MKFIETSVKSESKEVGKVNVPLFDSLQEAITYFTETEGSEEKAHQSIRDLVICLHQSNLLNAVRELANPVKSVKQIQAEILSEPGFFQSPEFLAVSGDPTRFQAYLEEKIKAKKAEYEKKSKKDEVEALTTETNSD